MAKKITVFSLIILIVLTLTACSSGILAKTNEQLNAAMQQQKNNESNTIRETDIEDVKAPKIGKYRYIPDAVMAIDTPGENDFTGNFYYVHAFDPQISEYVEYGAIAYLEAITTKQNYELGKFIVLEGLGGTRDDWYHEDFPQGYLIFFEYIGYSEEYGTAFGIYNSHENGIPIFEGYE